MVEFLGGAVVGLAVGVLSSRALGLEGRGMFAFMLQVSYILQAFLVAGSDRAALSYAATGSLTLHGTAKFLADNVLLDSVGFGLQQSDRSTGRTAADPAVFTTLEPTPGSANSG